MRKISTFILFALMTACGNTRGAYTESLCSLDADFNSQLGSGFTGSVEEIIEASDGKLWVAGGFTEINGTTREGLVRLQSSGAIDTTFTTEVNDSVNALAVDSAGSLFIGGSFSTVGGVLRNRLAKLSSVGVLDSNFASAIGSGPNDAVSSLAIDSSGRIVAGGTFTSVNGSTANRLVRLAATGSPDTTFQTAFAPGCNLGVDTILPLAGGGLLFGGSFSTCVGSAPGRLYRVDGDGDAATNFNSELGVGFDNVVRALVPRSSGGYLVGGDFSFLNSQPARALVAILDDGTPDTDFNSTIPVSIDATVRVLAKQDNGKFAVGGDFTKGIVRLEEDGSLDVEFASECGSAFDGPVRAIVELSTGALLVGGEFNSFKGNTVGGLALLR